MAKEEIWVGSKQQFDEFEKNYVPNTQIHVNQPYVKTSLLYSINTPFQITYETCSGTGQDDFLNITTLSEKGSFFTQEMVPVHNYMFRHAYGHYHDYYEFLIVLEGCVRQEIEEHDYIYPAGTCCLINRNIRHKETFLEKSRVLFLGFSSSYCKHLFDTCERSFFPVEREIKNSTLYQFIEQDQAHPDAKRYLDFIPALKNAHVHSALHELTETLLYSMLYPQFGSTLQVEACFCRMLQELAADRFHCTPVDLADKSDRLLFSRIEHLLEENNGRLSRQELSEKLNYSGDYINRIVNKYAGVCLHDFAMQFCLKQAAHLLHATNLSIAEIALELGFSNRTYFYRLFKEAYGVTPREYRGK